MSRCSISPSGQFTIGKVTRTAKAPTISRTTHDPEEFSTIVTESTPFENGFANANANANATATANATSFTSHSEVSVILGDNDHSVLSDKGGANDTPNDVVNPTTTSSGQTGELATTFSTENAGDQGDSDYDPGDMDLPDQDPSPHDHTPPARSAQHDLWRMEDPYDASGNRPIPYSRGKVLLDKQEVRRRNEQNGRRSRQTEVDSFLRPADLLFVVKPSELGVFR